MKTIQDYLSRSKSKNLELVLDDDIPLGAAKDSPAVPDSSRAVEEEYVSKRKLTSSVWKEFKRKKIDSKWKAECLWCHKRLGGDTKNGTKHLHDHLSKCPRRRRNKVSKPAPSKCTKDTDEPTVASLEGSTFSQDVARMELLTMKFGAIIGLKTSWCRRILRRKLNEFERASAEGFNVGDVARSISGLPMPGVG